VLSVFLINIHWLVIRAVAVAKVSASEGLWQLLASNLVQVLGALSSEAVGSLACFSNLSGLGISNGLFSVVLSVDGYVLSRNFVARTLRLTVFSLLVVTVPVNSLILLLELVIGSSSGLRLTLRSGTDLTVALTVVGNARAFQLRCDWLYWWWSTANSSAWSTLHFDSSSNS